jgi:MoxR-like ATPase
MGICLVGGENLFLLGPPGTAKSALVISFSFQAARA